MTNYIAKSCGLKGREGMDQARGIWRIVSNLAAGRKRFDVTPEKERIVKRRPELSSKDIKGLRALKINPKFIDELAEKCTVLARATRDRGRIDIKIGTHLLAEENTNESPPVIPIYAFNRDGTLKKDEKGMPKIVEMRKLIPSFYSSVTGITKYMYVNPKLPSYKGMAPRKII